MKLKCDKCGAEAEGLEGHVNKKHKKCGDRKPATSKENCGKWRK